METHGIIASAPFDEAGAAFDCVGPTAQVVACETAKTMEFDREEYSERVIGDVIETVRNALFAGLLSVTVGIRAEFDDWRSTHKKYVVVGLGNPDVERVAWHTVSFAETVLVMAFQNEEDAAASALRRNAFGCVYRDALLGEEAEGDDDASAGVDDNIATDIAGTDGDATGADR